MKAYRTEEFDDPQQFSEGPRAALARELADAWRPDHRPQTLREEIDAAERGPRGQLAHDLRNSHLTKAAERNRVDDALSHLEPRARLAVEVNEMWRAKS